MPDTPEAADSETHLTVTQAAALWDVEPGYLNSSSYGPPPRPGWDAMQLGLEQWRYGGPAGSRGRTPYSCPGNGSPDWSGRIPLG